MTPASASMTKRSEELGFNSMICDSGNNDGVASSSRHNDATIPLPLIPVSIFPPYDMNETSQCYSNKPVGQNPMINSSQFESARNFLMDHQGEERKHLPSRSDSGFQYQHARPDNLTTPTHVMNAAFYLNSNENPHIEAKCVTPSDSLAGRSLMVNHTGPAINGSIGQPQPQPLPAEFGLHIPNSGFPCSQGYIGRPYQYARPDNLMVLNDTSNASFNLNSFGNPPSGAEYVVNANFGVHMINANQGGVEPMLAAGNVDERFMTVGVGSNMDSGSNIPRINVTGNFTGFRNNGEVINDLVHTGNREALFDSRSSLHLGPSDALQRPATSDRNYSLRPVNRGLGLGGADIGRRIGLERCETLSSVPFVGSQILPSDNRQSMINRQQVPSSIGMVTDQSLFGNFSSQSLAVHPLGMAIGSTRGQGSSNLGMQMGQGNSGSREYGMSSSKRGANSQLPLSSVHQGQRRRTHHPLIQPSIPNTSTTTPQPIPPFITIPPPIFPTTPIPTPPFLPPRPKRIPNQQLSFDQQRRLRAQIMPSTTNIYPHHIKYKDETTTPEAIGHKCFLCKRDLSYTPEGPIVQPLALPAAAVLPCGHTFHEQCLERITPHHNSADPPCIPCALGDDY
ncbi:hypothetical protein RIF29_28347 [Crotalaria pallida]|uniref:RING-type domain-containing protein n=1 Tax=Crotalaria pallida TaxID=3830 RepID=A0AAN9EQV7_CROPI